MGRLFSVVRPRPYQRKSISLFMAEFARYKRQPNAAMPLGWRTGIIFNMADETGDEMWEIADF